VSDVSALQTSERPPPDPRAPVLFDLQFPSPLSCSRDIEANARSISGGTPSVHVVTHFGMTSHHATVSNGYGTTASLFLDHPAGVHRQYHISGYNPPSIDRSNVGGGPSHHKNFGHHGASTTSRHPSLCGASFPAPFTPLPDRRVQQIQSEHSFGMRGVQPNHSCDRRGYPPNLQNTSATRDTPNHAPTYCPPHSSHPANTTGVLPWAAGFNGDATAATRHHQIYFQFAQSTRSKLLVRGLTIHVRSSP